MTNLYQYIIESPGVGGSHLYFRLDIILVKGLSKHILITYFPGMKTNPKYEFMHVFFLIFRHLFSKIYDHHQKHTLFPLLHIFVPLNYIHAYCLVLENDPSYMFHFTRMIPTLKIQVAPLGSVYYFSTLTKSFYKIWIWQIIHNIILSNYFTKILCHTAL